MVLFIIASGNVTKTVKISSEMWSLNAVKSQFFKLILVGDSTVSEARQSDINLSDLLTLTCILYSSLGLL